MSRIYRWWTSISNRSLGEKYVETSVSENYSRSLFTSICSKSSSTPSKRIILNFIFHYLWKVVPKELNLSQSGYHYVRSLFYLSCQCFVWFWSSSINTSLTPNEIFLHGIIQLVTELILTITNEHIWSNLCIKLLSLIFRNMNERFAIKDMQMLIRYILTWSNFVRDFWIQRNTRSEIQNMYTVHSASPQNVLDKCEWTSHSLNIVLFILPTIPFNWVFLGGVFWCRIPWSLQ